jgi:hypothetical protein
VHYKRSPYEKQVVSKHRLSAGNNSCLHFDFKWLPRGFSYAAAGRYPKRVFKWAQNQPKTVDSWLIPLDFRLIGR